MTGNEYQVLAMRTCSISYDDKKGRLDFQRIDGYKYSTLGAVNYWRNKTRVCNTKRIQENRKGGIYEHI